ncbi:MAG: hypothetical protein QF888_07560, partial [Desulfobacterales bacterium]|nr:hypothetical protein [Desulfobacterales bacterium]
AQFDTPCPNERGKNKKRKATRKLQIGKTVIPLRIKPTDVKRKNNPRTTFKNLSNGHASFIISLPR